MSPEPRDEVSPEDEVRYQGLFIAAREQDKAFIAEGGTIYYVMDSNIAGFFADPPGRALADPGNDNRRIGYAAIFRGDPPEPARALAAALADYLLNDLSPNVPLLLTSPMDEMVFDWMGHLRRDEPSDEEQPKLRSEAESLLAQLTDEGMQITPEEQEAAAATIQKLLFLETGAPATLRNLIGVARNSRIASASPSARGAAPLPERLRKVLEAEAHWLDEDVRAIEWRDRIKSQTKIRRSRSVGIQSRVLARLERWNDRLNRTGGKARLVFVTGDSLLLDAGANFKVDGDTTFTDLYLRHPRAYLADVPMLQQMDAATNVEGDGQQRHWLQLWPRQRHRPRVEELELSQSLEARWTEFLKSATASYRQQNPVPDKIADWKREMAEGFGNWQAKHNQRLQERTAEFWEDCFFVATNARIILGQSDAGQPSARNAPPLYLAAWPKTGRLVDRLLAWTRPQDFKIDVYESGIKDLHEEFTNRGDNAEVNAANDKYAYYLAHAALFAGRGDWAIAAKVAAEACRHLVPLEKKTPEHANGREAYYMQAICGRYAVRNLAEIETLKTCLEKAEDIARQERENVPWADCVTERFEAEHLALRLTRTLLETYHSGPAQTVESPRPCVAFPRALAELIPAFDEFWTRVSLRRDVAEQNHHREPDNVGFELHASILKRVELRAVGSLLSIAVLDPSPDSGKVRSRALEYMRGLPEVRPDLRINPFADFVIACAELRMAETESDKVSARTKVEAMRNNDGIARATVFPYDRVRLAAISQAAFDYS